MKFDSSVGPTCFLSSLNERVNFGSKKEVKIFLGRKKLCVKKIVSDKISGPKINSGQKNFWFNKKILGLKILAPKKF